MDSRTYGFVGELAVLMLGARLGRCDRFSCAWPLIGITLSLCAMLACPFCDRSLIGARAGTECLFLRLGSSTLGDSLDLSAGHASISGDAQKLVTSVETAESSHGHLVVVVYAYFRTCPACSRTTGFTRRGSDTSRGWTCGRGDLLGTGYRRPLTADEPASPLVPIGGFRVIEPIWCRGSRLTARGVVYLRTPIPWRRLMFGYSLNSGVLIVHRLECPHGYFEEALC